MKTAGRVLLLVLLVRWTLLFLLWPMKEEIVGGSFLHSISLPFHEAGHIIFAPFGDLMTSLGGSLTQIVIPLVCMVAFLKAEHFNPFAAAVMLWKCSAFRKATMQTNGITICERQPPSDVIRSPNG